MVRAMYELTPKMEQKFRLLLAEYHKLFDGSRCSGPLLEELLVNSIKSDTRSKHHAIWEESRHDDNHDILVEINGLQHFLKIKSGTITGKDSKRVLTLSGHRLGRFEADLHKISDYLNTSVSEIISVPYRRVDDESGRRHIYRITYISSEVLKGVTGSQWVKKGTQYKAVNKFGVELTLSPKMSWQVWWKIPYRLVKEKDEFNATPEMGLLGSLGT